MIDEAPPPEEKEDDKTWGDRLLVPGRPLSPRHRKLAELAAQGIAQGKIAEQLDYTPSRVSILLSNTQIREEVERIKERIYEDTVGSRLKRMVEPALAEIEKCLSDRTNRYKEALKQETAKWVIEKIDGKATQKYDVGENMLGIMMDRLDALKSAGAQLPHSIDVTTVQAADRLIENVPIRREKSEEDLLEEWVLDFDASPSK